MKKKVSSPEKATSKTKTLTVRDPRSGKLVVVHGAGAMVGRDFELQKGVSLLKPIAMQTLTRPGKFKIG